MAHSERSDGRGQGRLIRSSLQMQPGCFACAANRRDSSRDRSVCSRAFRAAAIEKQEPGYPRHLSVQTARCEVANSRSFKCSPAALLAQQTGVTVPGTAPFAAGLFGRRQSRKQEPGYPRHLSVQAARCEVANSRSPLFRFRPLAFAARPLRPAQSRPLPQPQTGPTVRPAGPCEG